MCSPGTRPLPNAPYCGAEVEYGRWRGPVARTAAGTGSGPRLERRCSSEAVPSDPAIDLQILCCIVVARRDATGSVARLRQLIAGSTNGLADRGAVGAHGVAVLLLNTLGLLSVPVHAIVRLHLVEADALAVLSLTVHVLAVLVHFFVLLLFFLVDTIWVLLVLELVLFSVLVIVGVLVALCSR